MGRMLALSPSERVRVSLRLSRFALAVAIPSILLWIAYAMAWGAIASRTPGATTHAILSALVLAICGILFTQVAAVGMRYFHWRLRLGPGRHALAIVALLGALRVPG